MPRYNQINWDAAACKGMPTNLFYVFEENSKVRDWLDISIVRRVCFACPLWKQCLSYALTDEDYGMWGGLLTAERRALVAGEPSPIFGRVIQELFDAGIAIAEIQEVLDEYPRDERSMANQASNE
jgi:WhiB family transcriptional regulator, redox-sensing transcriptional regulator